MQSACGFKLIWLSWFCIWFGISNTCGGACSNGVGKNREIDEEHDEDFVLRRDFSWLGLNLTEILREAGNL